MIMQVELTPQKAGGSARRLFPEQFPELPLPPGIAQENEHDLSRDHVEGARREVAQVVEAF